MHTFVGAALLGVLLVACGDAAAEPEPEPAGEAVDWTDPGRVVTFDGGWAVRACEGDAPLLCVERDGTPVGVVEATTYPVASFDTLDPERTADENLRTLAAGFVETFEADRAAGCGAEYVFEPLPAAPFTLGAEPGVVYGFAGTMPDGQASELNLQYAAIVGDRIVAVTAIAYDEGGCPGRDDLSSFDSGTLAAFRPFLETVLINSPLPIVG